MKTKSDVKLTSMVKTSGCAAKLPPEALHSVIDKLPLHTSDRLIEGGNDIMFISLNSYNIAQ